MRLLLHEDQLFDDVTVDAVILLVGAQRDEIQDFVVAKWGEDGQRIDRVSADADGWRGWFTTPPTAVAESPAVPAHRLDEVAVVRRGVATGKNAFFLLSEDALAQRPLPPNALQRVVHRLRMFGARVTEASFIALPSSERSWLLSVDQTQSGLVQVAAYLKNGEDDRVDERYLCKNREPWYDLSRDVVIPDVIVNAMSKDGFRIVDNEAHAAITNNLYGLKWNDNVAPERRAKVLAWLRSHDGQKALRSACRRQGGSLNKLEPKALAALELPASLFT